MNCRQCQEQLSAYLEGLLEPFVVQRIESHLGDCSDCRVDFDEARRLFDCLAHEGQTSSDASLDIPVTDRIIREQAFKLRRIQMQKRIRWMQAGGAVTAAVVLIAFAGAWLARPAHTLSAAELRLCAAQVMAKGAEAGAEVNTIHIRARMRTQPAENLGGIDVECDFVPVELWREFDNEGRWRIEKPRRVIVMDGASQTVFIKPDYAAKLGKPSPERMARHWLHRVAAVGSNIGDELRSALAKGWNLSLTHGKDENGVDKATVVIDVRTDLEDGDWVKNKVISESDTRRTYRFDRKTGRLEGLEILLREKDRDVLVFEIIEIEYNQPIDPKLFELELPDNVVFREDPKELPDNERYAQMTPEEAARGYFEACAREDWDEYKKFYTRPASDRTKTRLGGLEVLSIGKAFRSGSYAGWYVPFEIKLTSGEVQKFNLPMRNDNPGKRFVADW